MSTTLRSAETTRLLELATAGASASIIGVSGSGKSNLFNHLLKPATQRSVFGDDAANYLLLRINFHYADEQDTTLRSVFSLILDQIELLEDKSDHYAIQPTIFKRVHKHHRKLIDAINDPLKVHYHFTRAIRALMSGSKRHLIFLFDQFESVYQNASERLFLHLRGLREDYKYRVSYFVFTRSTLTALADSDPAREEFYELVAPNLLGLKPYTVKDAASMLNSVAKRYQLTVDATLEKTLYKLTGGHAGTLRAAWLATQLDGTKPTATALFAHPNIQHELHKVWASLAIDEQQVLHKLAAKTPLSPIEPPFLQLLHTKGLITGKDNHIFSQLFKSYVSNAALPDQAVIVFDKATRIVRVYGKPIRRFPSRLQKIFEYLYKNANEVVSRDELIDAGWPEAQGGITNDAINQNISRIRKLLGHPELLESIHGEGYQLIKYKSAEE